MEFTDIIVSTTTEAHTSFTEDSTGYLNLNKQADTYEYIPESALDVEDKSDYSKIPDTQPERATNQAVSQEVEDDSGYSQPMNQHEGYVGMVDYSNVAGSKVIEEDSGYIQPTSHPSNDERINRSKSIETEDGYLQPQTQPLEYDYVQVPGLSHIPSYLEMI